MKQKTAKTVSPSSPLLRGLSILKCFSESNAALSVTELARRTGIPQPTVWRFCQTFRSAGYLTTDSGQELCFAQVWPCWGSASRRSTISIRRSTCGAISWRWPAASSLWQA